MLLEICPQQKVGKCFTWCLEPVAPRDVKLECQVICIGRGFGWVFVSFFCWFRVGWSELGGCFLCVFCLFWGFLCLFFRFLGFTF